MRRYTIPVAILATGLALGGCASTAEMQAANMARRAANEARDDSNCRAMGFQPGADDYKLCRLTTFQAREDRDARIGAEREAARQRSLDQGFRYLQQAFGPRQRVDVYMH
ncbi:MAG: hypothetical protein L0Y60_04260 [Beijerinckiaceae bacterium]|nr:hypothetical protein [Beijerinckiaceae bacterium]